MLTTVEANTLESYEITPDGERFTLKLATADGQTVGVALPTDCLKALIMTLPTIQARAFCARWDDPSLRLVYPLDSWTIERAADGERLIVTFTTLDKFSVSFGVAERSILRMAEVVVDYEVEADPDGLRFN